MEACIIVLGLFMAVTAIATLLSSPPDLPKVSLTSLTVTKFNSTGDHISGYLIMQFQVLNPNLETDLFYNNVNCSVYHSKHRLASTVSPHFVPQINVVVHLTPWTTARGIGNDLATYGFADFDVKLTAVKKWLFWSSEAITVSCDDVVVGPLPASARRPPACVWWSRQDDWSGEDMPGWPNFLTL